MATQNHCHCHVSVIESDSLASVGAYLERLLAKHLILLNLRSLRLVPELPPESLPRPDSTRRVLAVLSMVRHVDMNVMVNLLRVISLLQDIALQLAVRFPVTRLP